MKAEEFYKGFFGVQGVHPNGTTINKSVIRFAEAYAEHENEALQKQVEELEDRLADAEADNIRWARRFNESIS